LGTIAALTIVTATARGDRTDGHTVAFFAPCDRGADLIHYTDTLMTEQPAFWEGHDTSYGMDVRGADEGGSRFNHGIIGTGFWYRLLDDTDLAHA
jgi:hypothetical protein